MNLCLDLPNGASILGQWLYDWQTLLSGLLAVGAAAVSVYFLKEQISKTEQQNRDDLVRRHNAARVVLPLVLSSIHEYCQSAVSRIAEAIEKFNPENLAQELLMDKPLPASSERLAVPTSAIEGMANFVETLTQTPQIKHVSEIIGQIQIFQSRFDKIDLNDSTQIHGFYGLLIDAATVSFLNESLYNYARGVDASSFAKVGILTNQEAWIEIQRCANSLVFLRPRLDMFASKIGERIRGYIERNESPWLEKFEV